MDAIDAIIGRRTIRQYTPDPIPAEKLEVLLRAAMSAPTANNRQPWHYVVITDRTTLDRIGEFHRHGAMLKQATAAILVCGDLQLARYHGHMILDCAAATENILIAAHAIGLGAAWLGIYPWEDRQAAIRQFLTMPAEIDPIALVSIGYPSEEKASSERYKPERIHYQQW